jgi:hypothetical protein
MVVSSASVYASGRVDHLQQFRSGSGDVVAVGSRDVAQVVRGRLCSLACRVTGCMGSAVFLCMSSLKGLPLWSSGQSSWLLTQRSRVRFPAQPDFLSSNGSGTGSTQPREDK